MQLTVEQEIFDRYPSTEIGFLVAKVQVKKSDPFLNALKQSLSVTLEKRGINPTNYVTHPNIAIWRKIYEEDFSVKPSSYRSSIEALLKRIVTGKNLWEISSVVDLYNCCSVLTLLPMGGYDLHKISGNIKIRYAKERESFQGLGQKEKIEAKANHVVYADEKRILCWLWNYKDSAETCIDEGTEYAVFFIDSVRTEGLDKMQQTVNLLAENLRNIQCLPMDCGILNRTSPSHLIQQA